MASASRAEPRPRAATEHDAVILAAIERLAEHAVAAGLPGEGAVDAARFAEACELALVDQLASDRLGWPLPPVSDEPNRTDAELQPFAAETACWLRRQPEWMEAAQGPLSTTLAAAHQHRLEHRPAVDPARGLWHERVSATPRKRLGAFYTPPDIVEGLLQRALDPMLPSSDRVTVCDPSCGGGAFLMPVALRLLEQRSPRVVAESIFGVDLDPVAVQLCRLSLLEALGEAASTELAQIIARNIRWGDATAGAPLWNLATTKLEADAWCEAFGAARPRPGWMHWPHLFPEAAARGGFDLVIGNPPFLNQLRSSSAVTRARAGLTRASLGLSKAAYTDASAEQLLLAVLLTRPGGSACMIQPQSLLGARDAQPVRGRIAGLATLDHLWIADDKIFEGASTRVCAPLLKRHSGHEGERAVERTVERSLARGFELIGAVAFDATADSSWSRLLVADAAISSISVRAATRIAAVADATADFRDQYYGLRDCIIEDSDAPRDERGVVDEAAFPKLITSGLIDLARCRWGTRPTRIHKRTWQAPRIDRAALTARTDLGAWVSARLTPKILLATQTRVLELIVDEAGVLVPSVPVITITSKRAGDLWPLAAVLASPLTSVAARQRSAGLALSADAIKLSAGGVLDLPCPNLDPIWRDAGELFRLAQDSLRPDAPEYRDSLRSLGELIDPSRAPRTNQVKALDWWWDLLGWDPPARCSGGC